MPGAAAPPQIKDVRIEIAKGPRERRAKEVAFEEFKG